jgi:hypothetical protein
MSTPPKGPSIIALLTESGPLPITTIKLRIGCTDWPIRDMIKRGELAIVGRVTPDKSRTYNRKILERNLTPIIGLATSKAAQPPNTHR